ncbi:MAG: hypothetical protein JOZ69_21210, partial [Myxococcales bacterium]|nr:hypothetical protein [Myxococcales bacterium]
MTAGLAATMGGCDALPNNCITDLTCDTGDAALAPADGATPATDAGIATPVDESRAGLDASMSGDASSPPGSRDAGRADALGDATSPIPIADRDATVPGMDAAGSRPGRNDAAPEVGADGIAGDTSPPPGPL